MPAGQRQTRQVTVDARVGAGRNTTDLLIGCIIEPVVIIIVVVIIITTVTLVQQ